MSETTVVAVGQARYHRDTDGDWWVAFGLSNGATKWIPIADGEMTRTLAALAAARREVAEAQQRCEWVAAALHGDPIVGAGGFDQLVQSVRSLQADLAAVRRVVKLQADRDWIIAPWLNEAGDYVWRVNVRDTPSKKRGADTYTGTAHVAATALDAGLRALAAQEAGDETR